MRMRGPDEKGETKDGGVWLGHRRLSIIGLEGGHQPFTSPDNRKQLIYNGEIYNYRSLKEQLAAHGYLIEDPSDTAVLLAAYECWGEDCVHHLDGIFSFLLINHDKKQFFAARDHVGAKPLYWTQGKDGLFFSSNIRALLPFNIHAPSLNVETCNHYLTTIKNSFDDQTFLEQMYQLRPGEKMSGALYEPEFTRSFYWEIPIFAEEEKEKLSFAEATEEIRHLLRASIQDQLVSDVPVAVFLSGGLDSSIISHEIHKTGQHLKAFNATCEKEGFDESSFAKEMATHAEMELSEITITPTRFWEIWQFLIETRGIPLSTPNEICIYALSRALGSTAKVALSGEGADELFGGYTIPQFGAYDFAKGREKLSFLSADSPALDQELWSIYGRNNFHSRWDHFLLLNSWFTAPEKQAILHPQLRQHLRGEEKLLAYYHRLFDKFSSCTDFDAHLHIHGLVNLENLLNRVDHASMQASVEVRVPFTSKALMEKIFALPDAYKMSLRAEFSEIATQHTAHFFAQKNAIETKRILREAYKSDLPASIVARPKMSFPAPFETWLSNDLWIEVQSTLEESSLLSQLFSSSILQAIKKDPTLPLHQRLLWPMTNIALWEQTI